MVKSPMYATAWASCITAANMIETQFQEQQGNIINKLGKDEGFMKEFLGRAYPHFVCLTGDAAVFLLHKNRRRRKR